MQLPVKTEQDFAQTLRDMYLSDPINSARLDVSFSQDNSRVEAARFLIQVSKDFFFSIWDKILEYNNIVQIKQYNVHIANFFKNLVNSDG